MSLASIQNFKPDITAYLSQNIRAKARQEASEYLKFLVENWSCDIDSEEGASYLTTVGLVAQCYDICTRVCYLVRSVQSIERGDTLDDGYDIRRAWKDSDYPEDIEEKEEGYMAWSVSTTFPELLHNYSVLSVVTLMDTLYDHQYGAGRYVGSYFEKLCYMLRGATDILNEIESMRPMFKETAEMLMQAASDVLGGGNTRPIDTIDTKARGLAEVYKEHGDVTKAV